MHRIRFRSAGWLLAVSFAAALSAAHAQSVGSAFTYQGELRAAGQSANAAYDFQFRLFNSASGTTQVGPTLTLAGVSVINGLFSAPLDFGSAQFAGDAQWLEISVRPATGGAFETLIPRTAVTPTPYALGAVAALANSVTGTSIIDGSVQAGDLAAGAVGTTQINTAQVQRRVSGTCSASQGVQSIGQDGTVVCGTLGSGTITGVTAGTGLTGGGTSGGVTLGIAAGGVGSTQINPAQVQARVSGTCAAGQYVRTVNQDGTVVCGTDATGAAGWGLTGNAGTNPATNFIGTTDAQPLELRTQSVRGLRIEPSSTLFGGTPITVNVIGGSSGNTVAAGVRGATIAGGGVPSSFNDPEFFNENPNRVTGHYGTVGGGYDNQAGDNVGEAEAHAFATVGGGQTNTASGTGSAIVGGFNNTARGIGSTVGGGIGNCAGGLGSWAGGVGAGVRRGFGAVDSASSCFAVPSSGAEFGDAGTFVWADFDSFDEARFVSTGPNQFLVRARGGVGINQAPRDENTELTIRGRTGDASGGNVDVALIVNNDFKEGIQFGVSGGGAGPNDATFEIAHVRFATYVPRMTLAGSGEVTIRSNTTGANTGVAMEANGGSWSSLSDRNLKTGIVPIDAADVLSRVVTMPMATWSYIAQGEAIRHMGPMAQDFAAAFGLGENNTMIATIDADGVALAAIQGLNAKLESERDALHERVERLDAENAALRARLEAIEARLGGGL